MTLNGDNLCSAVREASETGNITDFLRVMASNITLSVLNDILLFKQNRNTKKVGSKTAWIIAGKDVKEQSEELIISKPRVMEKNGVFSLDYEAVTVVDEKYTKGRPKYVPSLRTLSDNVTRNTGCAIETVSKSKLTRPLDGGEYNAEDNVFYIAETADENKHNTQLLAAYIRHYMLSIGLEEELLIQAVKYVLFAYFELDLTPIRGVLFRQLEQKNDKELLVFFQKVRQTAFDLLCRLELPMLDFDETAIVNQLLDSPYPKEFCENLYKLKADIGESEFVPMIDGLIEKVRAMKDGTLRNMFMQITQNGSLLTYPPYRIDINLI